MKEEEKTTEITEEAWDSVYSREKRLEAMRRKRMEEAAQISSQKNRNAAAVSTQNNSRETSASNLTNRTLPAHKIKTKHKKGTIYFRHLPPRQILTILIPVMVLICGIVLFSIVHHGKQNTEAEVQTETELIPGYPEKDITIGSTGCMLLHSPFFTSYPDAEGNYDFSSVYKYITPYYSKPDFMTCEFEGALGGEEMGYSGYPMFLSPDVIIDNIHDSGVDLQFLATNHIYDGGTAAFHRTMNVYDEKGLAYTGIHQSETAAPYYIADIQGVKVGFINYVYETEGYGKNINGLPLAEEDWNLLNSFSYDDLDSFYQEMQKNITKMKADGARFLIAQMHWGTEYQLEENSYQDEIAQHLCDMGIQAIIGGHPHCEQPVAVLERSDGNGFTFCIYSEGNALSNQRTYLMDEMPTGHTEDGAMITLTLHQNSEGQVSITNVDLLPTWVYRYQDNGSKYYILPLDQVEQIETLTGISGIKEEAAASYERTMEELGEGVKKAQMIFSSNIPVSSESDSSSE